MYHFTMHEDNGIALHIDRLEVLYFKKANTVHPFVFFSDDLEERLLLLMCLHMVNLLLTAVFPPTTRRIWSCLQGILS